MEKKHNLFVRILIGIYKVIAKIFKGIYYFFYSIRYFFYIPGITIASGILGFFVVALLDTLVKVILPVNFDTGFIETFFIATVFVALQVYIFRRKMNESLLYNWKKSLILTYIPIIFAIAACYFLNLEDFSKEGFKALFSYDLYPPEAFDEIYVVLLPFFAPHLWLGCLTGEFWISSMICTFINISVAWGICLVIGIKRDRFTNENLAKMDEERAKAKENEVYNGLY